MDLIFGTTNKTKIEQLNQVIYSCGLDINVLSLSDIGWDRGEIDENGETCEENAEIKARAIYEFCKDKNIKIPVLADDAGLFVKALGGRPGVFTGRYASEEIKNNPSLTKAYKIKKLLQELEDVDDRSAYYKACVVYVDENGRQTTAKAKTYGTIATEFEGEVPKIVFYAIFIPEGTNKTFDQLTEKEISKTYRYTAFVELFEKVGLSKQLGK